MKSVSISKVSKKMVQGFFEDGSWNWDGMTSILVERDNDKIIQIFGSHGNYGDLEATIELQNDQTCRMMGYGTILNPEVKFIAKASAYYVFK